MSTVSTRARPELGARRRPGAILALILGCQLMITVDITVVTIALPTIQSDLHFSPTSLSWVQNAYMLTFGGLLLLGGRTGDLFGRRRVFIAGLVVFTGASLLGGLAPTAALLVAARALQGVGAAFAGPSTLALIATNFAEGPARNRALALFSSIVGLGATTGLILGGALLSWASWPWVFFVNVPIGVVIVALAPRLIAQPERRTGRIDVAGALTGTAGMTLFVYGFIRAASNGWGNSLALLSFAGAVVLLGAFLTIQTRSAQPLMPLRLFADRNRTSAYLTMLLLVVSMFGVFFLLTQFLQDVLRLRPIVTGLAFLPMTVTLYAVVRSIPRLLTRFAPKWLVLTGSVLLTAGMAWLTGVDAHTGYASGLLGPMILLGLGVGFAVAPLNVIVLSSVPPQDSGVASGIQQTMQMAGGGLGLAVLVSTLDPTLGPAGGLGTAFTMALIFAIGALLLTAFGIRASNRSPVGA